MKKLLLNLSKTESSSLENIINDFASATTLASLVIDIRGKAVSDFYNFTSFCQTMRQHPQFIKLCQKCTMCGGFEASKAGQPYLYHCHAGLTNITFPLIVKNSLLGFLILGQSDTGIENNKEIPTIQDSESTWKEHSELRQKRNSVVAIPPERIQSAARLLEEICSHYSKEIPPQDKIAFTTKQELQNNLHQPGKEEIQKAIHFIQNNITKLITLKSVADQVYLSESYFSRRFKEEVGITFVMYLSQQRIERAKALLQTSDLMVETIARNVGFSSTSYFCKVFKQFAGTTPENYRKRYKL